MTYVEFEKHASLFTNKVETLPFDELESCYAVLNNQYLEMSEASKVRDAAYLLQIAAQKFYSRIYYEQYETRKIA